MNDYWRTLIFIVVVIMAVGGVLYFILTPLGAAVGLAGGLIRGTVPLSATVASWVIPAGGVGLALGGAAGALAITIKITQHAKDKPFEWLAPVLGVASGFILDLCAELYPFEGLFRVLFAGVVGALVVGSGILWRSKQLGLRLISVPMYLVVPGLVLYWAGAESWNKGLIYTLEQISLTTWVALSLFLLILALVALLGYLTKPAES